MRQEQQQQSKAQHHNQKQYTNSASSRNHPANEVFVTGTFDNWSKSEKLNPVDGGFEKEVQLPSATDKIYYKVRVDTLLLSFLVFSML